MRNILLAVALSAGGATAAEAAVTIIGGGLGRECYLAAEFKREAQPSIAICTRALDQESLRRRDRAATLVNRGIIHMQARDLDRATADYEAAIRLEPRLAEAHVNLGIALLYRGGADAEAVRILTEGIALGPARVEVAYYSRAIANEIMGNLRAAYEDYQAAAAARPGWEEPVEQLKRFSVERIPVQRG